jgi:PilZ domain
MPEQGTSSQTESSQRDLDTDRRDWIRFPSKPGISVQPLTSDAQNVGSAWLGTVQDVSPAGIGLVASERVEPGTVLIVELSSATNELMQLPLRVVHASEEADGQWIIGCELTCELSPQELSIFLGE